MEIYLDRTQVGDEVEGGGMMSDEEGMGLREVYGGFVGLCRGLKSLLGGIFLSSAKRVTRTYLLLKPFRPIF